jgi:hypothetical protein
MIIWLILCHLLVDLEEESGYCFDEEGLTLPKPSEKHTAWKGIKKVCFPVLKLLF